MPNKPSQIVLVAMMLLLSSLAKASRLKPGFHAVLCGQTFSGKTEASARKLCEQAEQRGRFRGMPRCKCAEHADIVYFDETTRPAFFIANGHAGKTPEKAVAACLAELNRRSGADDRELDKKLCKEVHSVYGPYKRKPTPKFRHDDYDDPHQFRFLDADGSWIDETGEAPCFVAGTLIATPDGEKPIESLRPGDHVRSFSIETDKLVTGRVTHVKLRRTDSVLELYLSDGRSLRVTANHPLRSLSRGAWIAAGELRIGEMLAAASDTTLTSLSITSISRIAQVSPDSEIPVYDLTVEPTHSYFANGIHAHNY